MDDKKFVVCDEVHHLQFSLPSFSPSILFAIIQGKKSQLLTCYHHAFAIQWNPPSLRRTSIPFSRGVDTSAPPINGSKQGRCA